MQELSLFVPITKVDIEKRLVYGTLAEEIPDNSGEIFDYVTSKPNFEKWSGDFEKITDGKSLGNLRAMHKTIAAGKLTSISFGDEFKRIDISAKVVDNDEWEKVQEGVYTGFSVGGKYQKRWADGELTRYTAIPNEASLVDRPCIPTATFTMIKADGTTEDKVFKVAERKDTDPEEGKDKIDKEVPTSAKEKEAEKVENPEHKKAEDPEEALAMAEKTGDLQKAGARNSKGDLERVQGIHDHTVALGADCSSKKAEGADDLQKAHNETLEKVTSLETELAKVQGEKETLEKRVKELESQPAPAKGNLKVVEKGQDISPVTETVEPIKKSDGTENDVATEIKKIHKTGGKRLN
jgi:hypothetical protein